MKRPETATKTERLLLGMTAVFLSGLLVFAYKDRDRTESVPAVETEQEAAQEEVLAELRPVELNTASAEELATLPGIGEGLAQRIVEYREINGPFASVEEIMKVSGIGEGKFEQIRLRITVEDAT